MTGDAPLLVVAIVGAASEIGREIQAVLEERHVPVGEWRLYDTTNEREAADVGSFPAELLAAEQLQFDGVDVAFLCGPSELSRAAALQASEAGALVIDLTQTLLDEHVPLVVPEVNADEIAEGIGRGVYVSPLPGATALAIALKPLDDAAELRRVVVTALEPVSSIGTPAVDEMAAQARALLAGAPAETSVLPQRMAFNLIPQVGELLPGGRTTGEWQVESQTRRLLGLPDLPIAVTSILAPVFYGQAYLVSVETERPLDAEAAAALLRNAPGILLALESVPPLSDVIGSDATHVGRLRNDPTVPHGLSLWVALDGVRKGAATNAVQIAERAIHARG